MTSITIDADDRLVEAARQKAQSENKSLDEVIRTWLAGYVDGGPDRQKFFAALDAMEGSVHLDRMPTREEMNAR